MFQLFTDRAKRVLVLAQGEARAFGHDLLGSPHILLALLQEGEGIAAKAMGQLGLEAGELRQRVQEALGPPVEAPGADAPPFAPGAKRSLELSFKESLALGHDYIGTEHLLLGLLREPEGLGARVLVESGLQLEDVRAAVLQFLSRPGTAPPSG